MEKLIDIDHVTTAYGNKTVLQDISLTIWKDDFLGIIGPNDFAEGYTRPFAACLRRDPLL